MEKSNHTPTETERNTQLAKRIDQLLEAKGMTASEASRMAIGRDDMMLNLKRDRTPGVWRIVDLANVLGVSLDALLRGRLFETQSSNTQSGLDTSTPVIPEIDNKVRHIMEHLHGFETYTLDGREQLLKALPHKNYWTLPSHLLHQLDISHDKAMMIEIKGDAMSPTFNNGDHVLVDISDYFPSPVGTFCIWDGYGLSVRRIDTVPMQGTTSFKLKPDNPAHESHELPMDYITIIGRVRWHSRRL